MRAFAFVLAISLAAPVGAAPRRVASLNLCTDELLLALAAPEQIASVTHLAQSPAESSLWRIARRYPKNDGSLLSIAGMKPDLVLTMGGGVRDRAGIARRLGVRTLDLPFPTSLADIRESIRKLGTALDREPRARSLLARIVGLERTAPAVRSEAIWLGGGGQTLAAKSLGADWMRLAGFRQRAIAGDRVSLEELLVRPPPVLLRSDYRNGQYSGAQRWLSHPLARGTGRSRTIATDGRAWTCMGPTMIAEIERLRRT